MSWFWSRYAFDDTLPNIPTMTTLKLRGSGTALAQIDRRIEPWKDPDWQRLWLASQAQGRKWRSLALVPAGPGASAEQMLQIAVTLAHTGMMHLGVPIHVADATSITIAQLVQFEEELTNYTEPSGMVLMALSALSDNVTAISLAKAADCALLCVLLEQMSIKDGKSTIERIGVKRFIGSAVFRSAPTKG